MTATLTPPMAGVVRWIAYALIVGATLLPYLGGFPLSYALMLLMLLLVVWQLTANRRDLPPVDPASLMFGIAFALLLVVFTVTARRPADVGFALNFFLLLLVYPLIAAFRHFRRADASRVLAILALVGTLIAVGVAIYQRSANIFSRAEGYYSDSLWATTLVIALGFIALIGVRVTRSRWNLAFFIGPIAALAVTVLAGSRGPLLAFVPLLVAASILLPRRRWIAPLLLLAGAGIAALVVGGLAWLSPVTFNRLWSLVIVASEVMRGDSVGESSIGIRVSLLAGAVEAFKASPWVGYGWGHFGEVIEPYVGSFNLARSVHQFHLHNDLADFAIAGGVVGIVAYGLIVLAPVVGALASPPDTQRHGRVLGTVALSLTYLVCGQSNALFGFEFLTTLYILLAVILLGWCRDPEPAVASS